MHQFVIQKFILIGYSCHSFKYYFKYYLDTIFINLVVRTHCPQNRMGEYIEYRINIETYSSDSDTKSKNGREVAFAENNFK